MLRASDDFVTITAITGERPIDPLPHPVELCSVCGEEFGPSRPSFYWTFYDITTIRIHLACYTNWYRSMYPDYQAASELLGVGVE